MEEITKEQVVTNQVVTNQVEQTVSEGISGETEQGGSSGQWHTNLFEEYRIANEKAEEQRRTARTSTDSTVKFQLFLVLGIVEFLFCSRLFGGIALYQLYRASEYYENNRYQYESRLEKAKGFLMAGGLVGFIGILLIVGSLTARY